MNKTGTDQKSVPFFCAIGNSEEFSTTQKGTNVPGMRTCTRMQIVVSDRARCEKVPKYENEFLIVAD